MSYTYISYTYHIQTVIHVIIFVGRSVTYYGGDSIRMMFKVHISEINQLEQMGLNVMKVYKYLGVNGEAESRNATELICKLIVNYCDGEDGRIKTTHLENIVYMVAQVCMFNTHKLLIFT